MNIVYGCNVFDRVINIQKLFHCDSFILEVLGYNKVHLGFEPMGLFIVI